MKNTNIPTLYEWTGGMPVFEKLTEVFYKKVMIDELLAPVFRHMLPSHQLRVAHFIAEVLGGPDTYSASEGSHVKMIQKHPGRHLTGQQRQRWVRSVNLFRILFTVIVLVKWLFKHDLWWKEWVLCNINSVNLAKQKQHDQ